MITPSLPRFAVLQLSGCAGCEVSLLNAATSLDEVQLQGDAATGVAILHAALEEPMRQLAKNAGHEGSVIIAEVRRNQKAADNLNVGFDVLAEDYDDMFAKGIIDPAKVVRSAVENAISIAAMILTTEALITDIPEKEKADMGGGEDMDM